MSDVIGVVKTMLDAYDDQKLDQLFIVHNEFVSTMTQKPKMLPLLPLEVSTDEELKHHRIMLSQSESLLDVLLKRYIETQVYQSVVENVADKQLACWPCAMQR